MVMQLSAYQNSEILITKKNKREMRRGGQVKNAKSNRVYNYSFCILFPWLPKKK